MFFDTVVSSRIAKNLELYKYNVINFLYGPSQNFKGYA